MSKRITTPKELLEHFRKTHPRLDFYGVRYYEICSEACTLVQDLNSELKKITEPLSKAEDGKTVSRLGPKRISLINNILRQESVTIAFAAMCLEAFIWDYASCGTSQNKADELFGSLNLVAKWVVIPRLLSGSDITRHRIGDTSLLGRLRKLKEARNDLVHPKSKSLPEDVDDAINALRSKKRQIKAKDAFGLIATLLAELEKVDKTNWWFFGDISYKDIIRKDGKSEKTT